ncbi:uncharacterized protein LOC132709668 isoform X2 [Pantherophis guttatus]|uniref:Uncharacterized protein LOC132709668 isoform X2 n=1 Tax=Pantherophis guttatus TaxID=94885 RepID=A0ABM3YV16_PANGU|nr:uncharacterized protein LOC132709668 isoform X2 [Pantherophis guttatus]
MRGRDGREPPFSSSSPRPEKFGERGDAASPFREPPGPASAQVISLQVWGCGGGREEKQRPRQLLVGDRSYPATPSVLPPERENGARGIGGRWRSRGRGETRWLRTASNGPRAGERHPGSRSRLNEEAPLGGEAAAKQGGSAERAREASGRAGSSARPPEPCCQGRRFTAARLNRQEGKVSLSSPVGRVDSGV